MILFAIFIFGLVFGSFFGVVTFRLPRGLSFVTGKSFCPKCTKPIKWHDNVPLLSYLLLRGKCRTCGTRISLREPTIELSTGLSFVYAWVVVKNCELAAFSTSICVLNHHVGLWGAFGILLLVFAALIVVFVVDLEKMIIPDEVVLPIAGLLILFFILFAPETLYSRLVAGFGVAVFLLFINLLTKGKGMGLGDVKFAIFPALYLDVPLASVWLFLSFIIGALIGVVLIIIGKANFGRQIPFGPFMVLAFYATLLLGDTLLKSYLPF